MFKWLIYFFILLIISPNSFCYETVNVYSYRKPQLINPMFIAFTEKTGIEVNSIFAKKGMLERIKNEGKNSPADVILTVDIGRLADLKNADLTQQVSSVEINKNIPKNFRDKDGHWFGLTSRARIIVASKKRVPKGSISTYESLLKDQFKGKVCTRSGKHPYMIALTASIITHSGKERAKQWLSGLKRNLARKPQGNDRAQVKAIHEGLCDAAIINHYYMAMMLSDPAQKKWAESVYIIFPNQNGKGTHMNVSGAALAKYAPNKNNGLALLKFLSSDIGQELYSSKNSEYPVSKKIKGSSLLESWGKFKQDDSDLNEIAENRKAALIITDSVGYNF